MKPMLPDDAWRGLLLPAGEALVTAILAFPAGLGVCALASLDWHYAAIASALVGLVAWLGFLGWWQRIIKALLIPDQVEYYEPEPEPPQPAPIRIEIIKSDPGSPYVEGQYLDLPCEPDQLQALASGLAQGQPFALSTWTGRNRPFSRSQFETVRVELLARGLVRWSSPHARAQGLELTPAGRAVFKRLAAPPPGDHQH